MWVAVPTGYRSACVGSSIWASRCVKTAISLPFAIASSMRRTELSRATASGMNEFGKRTVSRSGRIGSSGGIDKGRSLVDASSDGRFSVLSLMAHSLYGLSRWEDGAPPPAEPRHWDAGCLHVEEQRGRAAARGHLALALLGVLLRFLAVLAADRERQRAETLLRNLLAAVVTIPVVALLEAGERVVDLVQRLGLHLHERELEILLDVGLGALDRVEHLIQLASPGALFAHAAHFALDLGLDLATPFGQHLFELAITRPRHLGVCARLLDLLHDRRSFRR